MTLREMIEEARELAVNETEYCDEDEDADEEDAERRSVGRNVGQTPGHRSRSESVVSVIEKNTDGFARPPIRGKSKEKQGYKCCIYHNKSIYF